VSDFLDSLSACFEVEVAMLLIYVGSRVATVIRGRAMEKYTAIR
jgi:hypothetical protein